MERSVFVGVVITIVSLLAIVAAVVLINRSRSCVDLDDFSVWQWQEYEIPGFLDSRPTWENQVMEPSDLHDGMVVDYVVRTGEKLRIVILEINADDTLSYAYWPEYDQRYRYVYMESAGLVPTSSGMWNATNHFLYTDVPDLTDDEVQHILLSQTS